MKIPSKDRVTLSLLVGVVILIGVLGLFGLTHAYKRGKIGVNEHPSHITETTIRLAREANMSMLRTEIIYPYFDIVYDFCSRYGVEILGLISVGCFPSEWTVEDFENKLRESVTLYPKITCYEIFNEVDQLNIEGNPNRTGPLNVSNWEDVYLDLIKRASVILRPAGKFIIAPCFSYLGVNSYSSMYEKGVADFVDIIPIHPYANDVQSMSWWNSQLIHIDGLYGKPFWATEFGSQSTIVDQVSNLNDWMRVLSGWFQEMLWYEMRDEPRFNQYYGLLKEDYTPKPIYWRVKEINNE